MTTPAGSDLNLPLDVASRLEGLFLHILEVKKRDDLPLALADLVNEFEDNARQYIADFKQAVDEDKTLASKEKWQKYHLAVDKITDEWGVITNLVVTNNLGSSYLDQFDTFLEQAKQDLGITDPKDRFVLFPVFGEDFSLTRFLFLSRPMYMLRLPVSAVNAKWEWSIIWHEMAAIKVQKNKKELKEHLETYAKTEGISTDSPKKENLFTELFNRIEKGKTIDHTLRDKIKTLLFPGEKIEQDEIELWSIDWLEQLYEDACSVLAFGDVCIFVLEKILSRNLSKLTSDRKHPSLGTRIQVATRLNERKKGSQEPPRNHTEELADALLWNFIVSQKDEPEHRLAVAFEKPDAVPAKRQELIAAMEEFKAKFDQSATEQSVLQNLIKKYVNREAIFAQSIQQAVSSVSGEIKNSRFAAERKKGVDALLAVSFSETDQLNIASHNHIPGDQNCASSGHWETSIYVHGKDHDIWGANHI